MDWTWLIFPVMLVVTFGLMIYLAPMWKDDDENSDYHDCPDCGNHHRRKVEDLF